MGVDGSTRLQSNVDDHMHGKPQLFWRQPRGRQHHWSLGHSQGLGMVQAVLIQTVLIQDVLIQAVLIQAVLIQVEH